jgi:uncharacterized protein YciU (UPF0263 family)
MPAKLAKLDLSAEHLLGTDVVLVDSHLEPKGELEVLDRVDHCWQVDVLLLDVHLLHCSSCGSVKINIIVAYLRSTYISP